MGSLKNTGAGSTRKKVAFFPIFLSERECPIGILYTYAPTFKIPSYIQRLFVSGSAISDLMLLKKIQESNVTSLLLDFKTVKPDLKLASYELTKVRSLHLTCTGEINFHSNLDQSTDESICDPYDGWFSIIPTRYRTPEGWTARAALREKIKLSDWRPVVTVLRQARKLNSLHVSNMILGYDQWEAICRVLNQSSVGNEEGFFDSLRFDFVGCDLEHPSGVDIFDRPFANSGLKHLTIKWLHRDSIWSKILRSVLIRSISEPQFYVDYDGLRWLTGRKRILESLTLLVPSLSELVYMGAPKIKYVIMDIIIYVELNQFNQVHLLVEFLSYFKSIRLVTLIAYRAPEYVQDLGFCSKGNYACTTFEEFKEYISKNLSNPKLFESRFSVQFKQME